MTTHAAATIAALLALAGTAWGQASQRAAFVGNNGNIEGSITSYTFSPSGVPQFVAKYITGSGQNNPGNNVTGISLTPDGRTLATTHATASTTNERVSIFRVNTDATLTPAGVFATQDSPLDCSWLSNDVLAVTKTNTAQTNLVIVYRYDAAGQSFTEIDSEDAGTFTAYMEVSPDRQWLIATDSSGMMVRSFRIGPDGELEPGVATPTNGTYVLDPGFTKTGRLRIYGGGGISNSSNKIPAFDFNSIDGSCTPLPAAPYVSPGSSPSPKLAVATNDGRFMLIGHGSSSTVRSFFLDEQTGDLTDTGFAFDVGIQGDLGDVEVLGDLVLVTDKFSTPNTGLYSFNINQDGSLVMNGGLVSSQGTSPTGIAAWNPPACYANCDQSVGSPALTANDFTCFLNAYIAGESYADCDSVGGLTANDFACFLTAYNVGCP